MTRSAPEATQNARPVIENIWSGAGLTADALNQLTLSGNQPALATSFRVAVAAQSAIACAALAGADLGRQRSGVAQGVQVDMAAALLQLGQNEKALELLTEAQRNGVEGPASLELLALTHKRLGQVAKAKAIANALARRFPQYRRQPEVEELVTAPK